MPQSTFIVDRDGDTEMRLDSSGLLTSKLADTNGALTEFDTIATEGSYGYLIQVPVEHHKIHEGSHYTTVDYDSDVDITGPKYWHIKAPDTTVVPHLVWRVKASLNGLVELFEAPTTTADGTALTSRNNDRNSSNTATTLFYYDPTVTGDGTRIDVDVIGSDGANPAGADGGDMNRETEWLLKRNTSYLIKFTSGTDNCRVSLHMSHYEVDTA